MTSSIENKPHEKGEYGRNKKRIVLADEKQRDHQIDYRHNTH
jgi:hypothetical protein